MSLTSTPNKLVVNEGEFKKLRERLDRLVSLLRTEYGIATDSNKPWINHVGREVSTIIKWLEDAKKEFPFTYVNILERPDEVPPGQTLLEVDKKYWGKKIKGIKQKAYADPWKAAEWFLKYLGDTSYHTQLKGGVAL